MNGVRVVKHVAAELENELLFAQKKVMELKIR